MPRLTRQRRKTASDNAIYNALVDEFLRVNPACAYCGRPATQCDHICSGPARRKTLRNFDTINACCADCNQAHYPAAVKLAAKLRHVVRAVIDGRDKAFSTGDDQYIVDQLEVELMRGRIKC